MSKPGFKERRQVAAHAAEAGIYEHADGSRLEIALPRLCGARQSAAALVAAIKPELHGRTVVLNARLLTVGTEAYADELLGLLGQRGVSAVELTPCTYDFERHMLTSAALRHLPLKLLG